MISVSLPIYSPWIFYPYDFPFGNLHLSMALSPPSNDEVLEEHSADDLSRPQRHGGGAGASGHGNGLAKKKASGVSQPLKHLGNDGILMGF